jgi:hypothetical protein
MFLLFVPAQPIDVKTLQDYTLSVAQNAEGKWFMAFYSWKHFFRDLLICGDYLDLLRLQFSNSYHTKKDDCNYKIDGSETVQNNFRMIKTIFGRNELSMKLF